MKGTTERKIRRLCRAFAALNQHDVCAPDDVYSTFKITEDGASVTVGTKTSVAATLDLAIKCSALEIQKICGDAVKSNRDRLRKWLETQKRIDEILSEKI